MSAVHQRLMSQCRSLILPRPCPRPPCRLRHFSYNDGQNMQVTKKALPTGRWYPGAATLPDGKVIMVAGVAKSGCSNYVVGKNCATANNPT